MKIAVSVSAPKSGAAFESRFGRAAAFIIVDTGTGDQQAITNSAAQSGSGAGIRTAETVIRHGVDAVISGAFGPKAYEVLHASNVQLYKATSGSIDELVARLQQGDLKPVEGV